MSPMDPDFVNHHYPTPAPAAAAGAWGTTNASDAPVASVNFGAENGNDCQPCSSSPTTTITTAERDSTSPPSKEDEEDKGPEATFPQQLMDLIEEETNNGAVTDDGERVVEWLPAGDSFVIRDKKLFEKQVLPRHFSAKCKFMSFVRKLYRWGFRQVEKSIPRVMIFTHTNFVRGDKKRCLKMRSIVKKQAAQRVLPPFANLGGMAGVGGAGGMGAPGLQGLASLAGQYGTMSGLKSGQYGMMDQSNFMGLNQFPQQALGGQMYSSSFNQGGGGDGLIDSMNSMNTMNPGLMNSMNSMNSNDIGFGGGSSLHSSMPNHFAGGTGMGGLGGMNSADMFEAGLRLREMEQNDSTPSMPFNSYPNRNLGNNMGGDSMSEVQLASEIMKRGDPGMEPWRALELAKRFNSAI